MSTDWSTSFSTAQAAAHLATQHELARRYHQAYPLYLSTAHTLLHLTRTAPDAASRTKAQKLAAKCVDRAGKLKAADSTLLARQGALAMTAIEVEALLAKSERVMEQGQPTLSSAQEEAGAKYERVKWRGGGCRPEEVRQTGVMDCSVVAGLASCVAHQLAHGSRLGKAAIFPQDAQGEPMTSSDGQYEVKLFLNGAKRTIMVDDSLPSGSDGHLLCASTGKHGPTWPSIVEKAYMKAMGGYDFPGSNSCIDLHAVTGWIPELIRLRSATFRSETEWDRLSTAFRKGHCVLTVGTGAAEEDDAFVSKHAYAVTDLFEEDDSRLIRLLNPWQESGWTAGLAEALPEAQTSSRTITWEALCARFSSVSVNWDPGIFSYYSTVHGTCDEGVRLKIDMTASDRRERPLWLHLERHTMSRDEGEEYIALSASIDSASSGLTRSSDFTNGSQSLLRLNASAGASSWVVTISRRGPAAQARFSLTAYSMSEVLIADSSINRPHKQKVLEGSWQGRSAGGNASLASFIDNPQYRLRIDAQAEVAIKLEGPKAFALNVKLVRFLKGQRVEEPTQRDIVLDSGPYTHGHARSEGIVPPGDYVLVISTYNDRQEGDFSLSIDSSIPLATPTVLASEGAGMFSKSFVEEWSSGNFVRYKLRFSGAPASFIFRLQALSGRTALALTVKPLYDTSTIIADSGQLASTVCGAVVRIDSLRPTLEGYAIELLSDAGISGAYRFLAYADRAFDLQVL